ncbi:putative thiazole-containing bacteriocin maturation protein [Lederbergia wuyishanensis]|uniref:Thiazole-containing bacteriocin maturation protein n=1 Tax=Lederbergia wuyishanensis TaxID=1347903 RepID=A0ABU0D714_9BACI|nr:putative thiazole-containing bacteriocin maturation protein [Lederbergia wuyishanensis]MCJ8008875.1 putative thiazole-containing bacteriocin maturation protein [Lederbergia wuyishanensis]MDQ0344197.1 putative thiazole-containing bacteriocin maturation protein [Lederbergia wuyishanensis]
MTKLNSSSRIKLKRDTFFLPDSNGGVYFRNNLNSFRMEGNTIYQWIEKLLPMFNGEYTMGELTMGLTAPYRDRVYEIGETLYSNGFVRDLSKDSPHQLNQNVLEKYASQIEFIENFMESGAYHFQEYRKAKVLAVGSGPFMVSLASALIESGLAKLNVMVTDSIPTNWQRLNELVQNARKTDSEVEIKNVPFHKDAGSSFWKQAVQPYDWILYVSQDGNINELRDLNLVCKEEKKAFMPAIYLDQVGLSGPFEQPDTDRYWETAWRRIHHSVLKKDRPSQSFSSTAGSILANVSVFELFKRATGIADSNESHQIYMLDLETLEGDWLYFIPHPLGTSKRETPRLVEDFDLRLEQEKDRNESTSNLLEYFNRLTSEEIGIFHTWEERDLPQLPLAQCYVQAVNPISEGPAELLPEVVCGGLSHEEAKKEAGLTGIEMYVSQMINLPDMGYKHQKNKVGTNIPEEFIGIGAGETIAEAVCRGLQVYLGEELQKRKVDQQSRVYRIKLGTVEDKRCRFYFNALTTLNGAPIIGLKEDVLGFPVVWVRSNHRWYTCSGLNTTLALRNALEQALLDAQNQVNSTVEQEMGPAVILENNENKLDIPSCDEMTSRELLQSSIQVLKRNRMRLVIYDLASEPFLKQELAGVFGVKVQEEGS